MSQSCFQSCFKHLKLPSAVVHRTGPELWAWGDRLCKAEGRQGGWVSRRSAGWWRSDHSGRLGRLRAASRTWRSCTRPAKTPRQSRRRRPKLSCKPPAKSASVANKWDLKKKWNIPFLNCFIPSALNLRFFPLVERETFSDFLNYCST